MPLTASDPAVQIVLSFSNIPETAFKNAAGVASLEASIAKAADVTAGTVKVTRVYNVDTNKIIFSARRLSGSNLEVTTKITTSNVNGAATLGATLKSSAATFATSVLTDLKSKDAATFQSATISVSANSIAVPPPAAPITPTTSTVGGLPIEIIAAIGGGGALLLIGLVLCVYCIWCKNKASSDFDDDEEAREMFSGVNPLSNPVIKKGSDDDDEEEEEEEEEEEDVKKKKKPVVAVKKATPVQVKKKVVYDDDDDDDESESEEEDNKKKKKPVTKDVPIKVVAKKAPVEDDSEDESDSEDEPAPKKKPSVAAKSSSSSQIKKKKDDEDEETTAQKKKSFVPIKIDETPPQPLREPRPILGRGRSSRNTTVESIFVQK